MQTMLGSSFMRNVILYHLQNDHIKNEISLGEQLKFTSDVECFESLEESCCILKEFTYQNC